jgi:hypothetical protein
MLIIPKWDMLSVSRSQLGPEIALDGRAGGAPQNEGFATVEELNQAATCARERS